MDINMTPNKISLATIGDCCVDIYPEQNKSFLGGTAFNVAYHAQNAGAMASIISVVGNDFYGSLFIKTAQECNINTDYLVMKVTTQVTKRRAMADRQRQQPERSASHAPACAWSRDSCG